MMYYNNNPNYPPQKRQQFQQQPIQQQQPIIPKIQGSTEMQTQQDYESLEEQYLERESFLIPRKYKLIELRGKGSYGVVAAARNTLTKKQVAIKKNIHVFPVYIPINNSSSSNRMTDDVEMFDNSLGQADGNAAMYVDSQTKKQYIISTEHPHRSKTSQLRILRELKILIHLGLHPNIICLRDVIPPRNFYSFSDVYFVNDLMEADLRDIVDSDQELSDEHVQYFMYQILIAMSYIHAANILHRDLKPENILLNSDCELKICDFGLARGMEEEDVTMSTAYVQTRWYRAPELLLNNPTVNKQVDIWSVGCIFAELMSRQVLFRGNNPLDQLKKIIYIMGTPPKEDIKSGTEEGRQFVLTQIPYSPGKDFKKLFPKANPMALDLMKKLLHFNPEKRYTAEQALRHPYFKTIFNEEDLDPSKQMKPFNYDFEQEADTKGLKEMCYETIMNFYRTKQGQARSTTPRIEVTPIKESNSMVDCSQTQKSKPAESPISDLMQSYFNNTTKIK